VHASRLSLLISFHKAGQAEKSNMLPVAPLLALSGSTGFCPYGCDPCVDLRALEDERVKSMHIFDP
jgi:hypothetical protein